MADILTFEPLPDPVYDALGLPPDGHDARLGWLPTVGPSSYLVWGTLAAQLRRFTPVTWDMDALARAHGLSAGSTRNGALPRTLQRLAMYRLIAPDGAARFLVRLLAPPLSPRQLARLPNSSASCTAGSGHPGARRR